MQEDSNNFHLADHYAPPLHRQGSAQDQIQPHDDISQRQYTDAQMHEHLRALLPQDNPAIRDFIVACVHDQTHAQGTQHRPLRFITSQLMLAAVHKGQMDAIVILARAGFLIINRPGYDESCLRLRHEQQGLTPLHIAVLSHEHADVLQLLLDLGATANIEEFNDRMASKTNLCCQTEFGVRQHGSFTPLLLAYRQNKFEHARSLLAAGASTHAHIRTDETDYGTGFDISLIHIAIMAKQHDWLNLFLAYDTHALHRKSGIGIMNHYIGAARILYLGQERTGLDFYIQMYNSAEKLFELMDQLAEKNGGLPPHLSNAYDTFKQNHKLLHDTHKFEQATKGELTKEHPGLDIRLPLGLASALGDEQAMRILLEAGADIDYTPAAPSTSTSSGCTLM